MDESKDAFFSLKINKRTGADDISFVVIKNYFGELIDILKYFFDCSLQIRIFLDSLKIARVTSSFKTSGFTKISNYRAISFLPCFSKILKHIMLNSFYSYLVNEKILHLKQFNFKKVIS